MPLLRRLAVLLFVPMVTLAAPMVDPSRTADAATFECIWEDRTTRPNGGGLPVADFSVKGVDLSHWNSVTAAGVKAAGQSFVYHKATQGTSMIDDRYASQAAAARKVGLKVGAYHFFDWRINGTRQARYFVAAVNARGGFHGRLRPVVDVECSSRLGKPVQATVKVRLRAFLTEVHRLVGVRPIIYTSIHEWQTMTGGSSAFGDHRLWSAEWGKTAPLELPPGWTKWTFWQYGGVKVQGKNVDGNVYRYNSEAALRALLVP